MFRALPLALSLILAPATVLAEDELAEIDLKIQVSPGNLTLHLDRAEQLLTLGRFDEALVACDAAAAIDAKDSQIALMRGRIFQAMGELGLAEHHLSIHLKTEHPSPEAYLLRAKIRERTGRYEEAIEDYEAARVLAARAHVTPKVRIDVIQAARHQNKAL